MTEDGEPYFMPQVGVLELAQETGTGAAQSWQMTRPPRLSLEHVASERSCSLGDHDDREPEPQRLTLSDLRDDSLEPVGDLRDEDNVSPAGNARVKRNPTGVAAHDFKEDHAGMRLGGRVEGVDGMGGGFDGTLESAGEIGTAEIIVDRLGNANACHSQLHESRRREHRSIAPDEDERFDANGSQAVHDGRPHIARTLAGSLRHEERVDPCRAAEHTPALGENSTNVGIDSGGVTATAQKANPSGGLSGLR